MIRHYSIRKGGNMEESNVEKKEEIVENKDNMEKKEETVVEKKEDNISAQESEKTEVKEIKADDIKSEDVSEPKEDVVKGKSNVMLTVCGILAVLLVASIITQGFRGIIPTGAVVSDGISLDEASEKAVTYINENLLQAGTTATVVSKEDAAGLYNVKLDIDGREFDSYVTKDGKMLFPNAIDMDVEVEAPEAAAPEPPADLVKSDKPKVELFVMSHCPFGTQAEKGMLPVAELLGDKIDFDIKFVNYAMHGEKEVKEQIRQECIKDEQPAKFLPYLKCFLADDNYERCLGELDIDVSECETATYEDYDIATLLADDSSRFPKFPLHDAENVEYGVRGSPTLVINGNQASSARSPAAYLATICGAFNEAPAECEEELSAASPSAGFGWEESASATAATCG